MTRKELAKALLKDKDKLDEEVYYYDAEYGEFFQVNKIKTQTALKFINRGGNTEVIEMLAPRFIKNYMKEISITVVGN